MTATAAPYRAQVCVIEPSGLVRSLDELIPARTAPLPPTPEPCQSCGHPAGECPDDCC